MQRMRGGPQWPLDCLTRLSSALPGPARPGDSCLPGTRDHHSISEGASSWRDLSRSRAGGVGYFPW